MRTFLALATLVALPQNMNIALAILFTIVRGLPMTAFLMTLGRLPNDAATRRLRQPSWRR
jgi:hypothetical protein